MTQHAKIKPVRVCDYLQQYPATDKLGHLFPGSWIQHNFGIWIGHPECNRAWDELFQTRQFLVQATSRKKHPPSSSPGAWDEMHIAEGSDWFWWFGESHSSAQDSLFDRLFRKHLQNVYAVLGEEPPAELARPISQGHRHPRQHTEPTGLLQVKVNGRRSYFEWINAGRYVCQGSRGTMSMAGEGLDRRSVFRLRHRAAAGPARRPRRDRSASNCADVEALRVHVPAAGRASSCG